MCPYNTLKEWEVKSMAFLPNKRKRRQPSARPMVREKDCEKPAEVSL
jgi:hypothetical protein